jgi:hypothetical protein
MYSKYNSFNPVACCSPYKAKDLSSLPRISFSLQFGIPKLNRRIPIGPNKNVSTAMSGYDLYVTNAVSFCRIKKHLYEGYFSLRSVKELMRGFHGLLRQKSSSLR